MSRTARFTGTLGALIESNRRPRQGRAPGAGVVALSEPLGEGRLSRPTGAYAPLRESAADVTADAQLIEAFEGLGLGLEVAKIAARGRPR